MLAVKKAALALVALGALVLSRPEVAEACGGCFRPPPDPRNPTGVQTVTDHRMALALSPTQTTLWDQFSWSGDPAQFSWVLPIVNGPSVRVELASDDFLTVLDNLTSPQPSFPSAPSRTCSSCYHPQRYCPGQFPWADASSAADAAASDGGGVTIFRRETLGPYEVVVLGGSDPMALRNWLTANSFQVPPSLDPVLQYYIDRHMDFVALRLAATTGVTRMQPVRVTVPGFQPGLPLRMISAGISDRVGLLLFTLSTGRVQTANFPNTEVPERSLAFDFAAVDYSLTGFGTQFRAAERSLSTAAGDRAWITELAQAYPTVNLRFEARRYDFYTPFGGPDSGVFPGSDAGDGGGRVLAENDVERAAMGLGDNIYITRLRADLPAAVLDRDLTLAATPAGTGDRSNTYRFGTLRNMPTPAACQPLVCQPGDTLNQVEEAVRGPYGEWFAPNTSFPAEYVVGALPTVSPPQSVVRTIPGEPPPLNCDGGRVPDATVYNPDSSLPWPDVTVVLPDGAVVSPQPEPGPRCQCDVHLGARAPSRAAWGLSLLGLGLALAARRPRRR